MFRTERGLSLIEALVAIVVFVMLVLMVDAVFISAHRSARKAELTADVDQNARVALERLTRELRESTASSVDCDPTADVCPPGSTQVIFQSARPLDGSSSFCIKWEDDNEDLANANSECKDFQTFLRDGTYGPAWEMGHWIGYYLDQPTGELRRVWYAGTKSSPGAKPGLPLPATAGQTIASHIESFDVQLSGNSVTIFLKARGEEVVQGSPVPAQEVVLEGEVLIRN